MGLLLNYNKGKGIELYVDPDTDPEKLAKLMAKGFTIYINDTQKHGLRAGIDITAPAEIGITRCDISGPGAG